MVTVMVMAVMMMVVEVVVVVTMDVYALVGEGYLGVVLPYAPIMGAAPSNHSATAMALVFIQTMFASVFSIACSYVLCADPKFLPSAPKSLSYRKIRDKIRIWLIQNVLTYPRIYSFSLQHTSSNCFQSLV